MSTCRMRLPIAHVQILESDLDFFLVIEKKHPPAGHFETSPNGAKNMVNYRNCPHLRNSFCSKRLLGRVIQHGKALRPFEDDDECCILTITD